MTLDQIERAGFDRVIGTSGTILSLGAVALGEEARQVRRRAPLVALTAPDRRGRRGGGGEAAARSRKGPSVATRRA